MIYTKEAQMKGKEQLFKYKGNRCAYCGASVIDMVSRFGTFNRMFEFHHIKPDEKAKGYKNIIRRNISTEQLEELDKCVLLCRQCHGILHAQNMAGTMEISVNINGKTVSQILEGQFISDHMDKKITFISNQRLLLERYRVIIGNDPEILLCGIELEKDNFLVSLLKEVDASKELKIYSINGNRLLMKVSYVKDGEIELSQAVDFPVFIMELCENNADSPCLWLRNGLILNKDGTIRSEGMINCNLKII